MTFPDWKRPRRIIGGTRGLPSDADEQPSVS